jgi:hypothetical protein
MSDEMLVPLVSDVAYGLLLLVAVVAYLTFGYNGYVGGYSIGVSLGYAVHTGSHMLGYSINTNVTDDDADRT